MTDPHHRDVPDPKLFAGTDEILQRLGYKPFKRPFLANLEVAHKDPDYRPALHAFQRDHGISPQDWTEDTGVALLSAAQKHWQEARQLGVTLSTSADKVGDLAHELGSFSPFRKGWVEWVAAHHGLPAEEQLAALRDAVIVRRRQLAIQQEKEKQMANEPTPPIPFVNATKNALQAGVQIGIGQQALKIAVQGTTKMLVRAGVPKEVLKLPLVKTLLIVGAPTILRAAAGKIPGLSHPRVLAVLELAQTSAYAEVTKDVMGLMLKQAGPLFKGLMSLGDSLMLEGNESGKDVPARVAQVDPIDIEATPTEGA